MTLIKSISGIRGTIGGLVGTNLTPIDIVECAFGYGTWVKMKGVERAKVVIGRDGRISGQMVSQFVGQTLISLGIDVIDLGLSTTPTVEMAVTAESANGGIIITASHNPKEWNALKFLNERGEFISGIDGDTILKIIDDSKDPFVSVDQLGSWTYKDSYIDYHIEKILDLPLVKVDSVKSRGYHIAVDCINSTGAISVAPLLDALGCTYTLLNSQMDGQFAHEPEPLEKNLSSLIETITNGNYDMGIAVDPDVDRLAFIDDTGRYIGEEYTIVAIADYILQHQAGQAHVVSNMSSSAALSIMAKRHKANYSSSPVGEVHVVEEMKRTKAVFGGEGNGGVIYPELHYGRDALVGIALALSYMSEKNTSLKKLRDSYPDLVMVKEKIPLDGKLHVDDLLKKIHSAFESHKIDDRDGVKIYFDTEWVHLRKSNTEPIVRIYAEGFTEERAKDIIRLVQDKINIFTSF